MSELGDSKLVKKENETETNLTLNSTDTSTQQKELTARQIFNRIIKGEVVRIPNDPILAKQLQNHLNVIKSREARIFRDLGLDFISAVISVEAVIPPYKLIPVKDIKEAYTVVSELDYYEIKIKAPKIKKKFTTFIVKDNEPSIV